MGVLEGGPTNTCPQKLETGLSEVVNYYYDFVVSAGHPLLEIHYLFLKVKNLGQKCDKRISFSTIQHKTLTTTKTFLSTLGIAKIFPFLHTVYKRRSIPIWESQRAGISKPLDFRWPSIMAMWIQSKNKTESMLLELVCSNSKHPYIYLYVGIVCGLHQASEQAYTYLCIMLRRFVVEILHFPNMAHLIIF